MSTRSGELLSAMHAVIPEAYDATAPASTAPAALTTLDEDWESEQAPLPVEPSTARALEAVKSASRAAIAARARRLSDKSERDVCRSGLPPALRK